MSLGNGEHIVRIGRKGKKLFALGDGEPFEIDVILVYNAWLEIDRSFRDDKGEVPPNKLAELNAWAMKFVTDLSNTTDLTMSESLEFLARLTEEANRLKDFFVPRLGTGPSSPERTILTVSE